MFINSKILSSRGQTFVEYTLLLGILIAIMLAMSPMIKRGTQGMVKVVADELGVQQNAEQDDNNSGHMISTQSQAQFSKDVRHQEWEASGTHHVLKTYDESTTTATQSASDLGFSPKN